MPTCSSLALALRWRDSLPPRQALVTCCSPTAQMRRRHARCLAGWAQTTPQTSLTPRAHARQAQVLANAAAAVALNGPSARCSVAGVSWGVFSPTLLALPPQSLILGADVLYDSAGALLVQQLTCDHALTV